MSCDVVVELLERQIAAHRALPPKDQKGRGSWNGTLAMLREAAAGLRADSEWAPSEARLLEEPSAGRFMMQFFASQALDCFDADIPLDSLLLSLYFRYARVLRPATVEGATLYEFYGAVEPPANPLLPNALATALGAPARIDNETLEAVGQRFADAHSFAAEVLRTFVEQATDPTDVPDRHNSGFDVAADMCNAVAASLRPFEVAEDPEHPLTPLLFTESDLLLIRAHTAEMGRALQAWGRTQPPGRTQTLAKNAGSALMQGETSTQKIVAEDAVAMEKVAAELESMDDGLEASPFEGGELWCTVTAARHVANHYRRATMTVAEMEPGEYMSGEHLTPPPPDLILIKLQALLEAAPAMVTAEAIGGFARGALLAADVMAGSALFTHDLRPHRTFMLAASTAERRARRLMMGPEVQTDSYDEYLPVIIPGRALFGDG